MAGNELVPRREEVPQTRQDGLQRYLRASKAPNTLRAYRADLADFTLWCKEQKRESHPATPETICMYLAALADAGAKTSTVERRLAAISQAHQWAGIAPPPTSDWYVRTAMAGIRRTLGTSPIRKQPVVTKELRRLLAATPQDSFAGIRDRLVLLLGFAGGFRRSELVVLDIEDVDETEEGLRVVVRCSKTDQEDREVGIPFGRHPQTCPVRAWRAWIAASGIRSGAVFCPINRHDQLQAGRLSDKGVALIVKRAALRAGLDPSKYAGHSLRSGFATAAAAGGAPERAIMRQTGHRSVETVRRYIRSGGLFKENAAAYVGL
jgi:site-specific recombinase XerD